MSVIKRLGANIRYFRLKKGFTQQQLGNAISTIQTNISLLEQGKLNPSVKHLEKVASALDVKVKELFMDT